MPLFQQSVLKKFLSQQEKNLVEKAFKKDSIIINEFLALMTVESP